MTSHMFGGTSSPSCCNYPLKKTAADNVNKYGNKVSTIVKRNVYVDDMLKSFPDVKAAGDMVKKVRALCLEGAFHLRKFTSNDVDLLRVIPNDLRKNGMKEKYLKLGNLNAARRGFLAVLSGIYDPLGLCSPLLLKRRQIIQTLCKQNLEWDDPIDDEIAQEWLKWRNNLITSRDKSLSRCMKLKTSEVSQIVHYTIL